MKRFKIGFASIIAILAISLTIAAQAGAFEAKKATPLANCFVPTSIDFGSDAGASCALLGTIDEGDLCTDDNVELAPGKLVFEQIFTDSDNTITPNEIESECPGDQVVCCIFIEAYPTLCPLQPSFVIDGNATAQYRITSVRCKD